MKIVAEAIILSFIKDKMQIFKHFVLYNSRLRLQYPKFTVWFYLSEEGRFFSFNQEKIHLFHIFDDIFAYLFHF